MPFQVIPNTESEKVALAAVAWEIVEKSIICGLDEGLSFEERKVALTNAFVEVYAAITKCSRIEEPQESDDALFRDAVLFGNR